VHEALEALQATGERFAGTTAATTPDLLLLSVTEPGLLGERQPRSTAPRRLPTTSNGRAGGEGAQAWS